jgi:hypothetical protein
MDYIYSLYNYLSGSNLQTVEHSDVIDEIKTFQEHRKRIDNELNNQGFIRISMLSLSIGYDPLVESKFRFYKLVGATYIPINSVSEITPYGEYMFSNTILPTETVLKRGTNVIFRKNSDMNAICFTFDDKDNFKNQIGGEIPDELALFDNESMKEFKHLIKINALIACDGIFA